MLFAISCNDTKKKDSEMDAENTEETMTDSEETMDKKMNNEKKDVSFMLESRSESNATGKVMFQQVNGKVTFEASLSGLAPGTPIASPRANLLLDGCQLAPGNREQQGAATNADRRQRLLP